MVENCAESAATAKPQTSPTSRTTQVGAVTRSPIRTAQDPETSIIEAVVFVRPQRSPSRPPAQQPRPPTPMTANVAYAAPELAPEAPGRSTRVKKTRNQAHIA